MLTHYRAPVNRSFVGRYGLPVGFLLDSLRRMLPRAKIGSTRPLGDLLLSPGGRLQRYRWLVLAAAIVLEVIVVFGVGQAHSGLHPLDPVGAGVVFISVLAAGVGGVMIGLISALAGVAAAFAILAELSTRMGLANALISAVIWCGAAVATGLVVRYLRRQVAHREAALEQALGRSLHAREQMERVLEFSPQFYESEDLDEVGRAICETAVETFGADGARLYTVEGDFMVLFALAPPSNRIAPGLTLALSDLPELERMLVDRRPSFIRDVRQTRLRGTAIHLQNELQIVSTVRIPVFSPDRIAAILALGWDHAIERPADELMAIMQRFADQAAIAWQNALRAEARLQADALHETLERLVALAPSFQTTGTREQMARAICDAAVSTFDCSGASLYRVEGDRLRVLDSSPELESLSRGKTFPLTEDMPLVSEIRSRTPTFIPDVTVPSRSIRPWPEEVVRRAGTRSALYVPTRFDERGPQNLLVLNWSEPREQPDEHLLIIIERFADQVALALSNASAERLHARLEASLLPTTPVDHPLLEVVTRYRTGEQRLRLGGDFVGSTPTKDGGLSFVIGDVSGHGPDAAALGATLRATWKSLVLAEQSIPRIVSVLRQVLLADKTEPNAFATVIVGQIDLKSRTLSFVNAAHLPPILIADRALSLDTVPASPLGFDKGAPWSLRSFPLPERWALFCYTDGLIEARVAPGASERYGEDRLKKRLAYWSRTAPHSATSGSATALDGAAIDTIMAEIETASGGRFADDVAILLISTKNLSKERAQS
jgi:serine phosphatase RsbU (regulator of sigma subunit)